MGQEKLQWNQGASGSIRRRNVAAIGKQSRDSDENENENNEGRRNSLKKVERMEYGKNKKGTERANRRKGRSDGLREEAEGVLTIVEHESEDGGGVLVHCYMFRRSCLA